jgi:flagellar basal-body rod protein FlgF
MNYGLYLSAGGALTNLYRQDVLANNLANLNTTGFKPDVVDQQSRWPERIASADPAVDPHLLLEQLGGGDWPAPTRINLRQGDIATTANPLDLAISGDGFFVVNVGQGQGDDQLRFTRDGRFTLNDNAELVMAATGHRVLNVQDQPIQLDPTRQVTIDGDGTIRQGDAAVATLQVSTVVDPQRLEKAGDDLIRFDSMGANARKPADGLVRQASLEGSAVDPILVLNDLMNVSKAIQANVQLMQYHDHILGQAINTFGRVA